MAYGDIVSPRGVEPYGCRVAVRGGVLADVVRVLRGRAVCSERYAFARAVLFVVPPVGVVKVVAAGCERVHAVGGYGVREVGRAVRGVAHYEFGAVDVVGAVDVRRVEVLGREVERNVGSGEASCGRAGYVQVRPPGCNSGSRPSRGESSAAVQVIVYC